MLCFPFSFVCIDCSDGKGRGLKQRRTKVNEGEEKYKGAGGRGLRLVQSKQAGEREWRHRTMSLKWHKTRLRFPLFN